MTEHEANNGAGAPASQESSGILKIIGLTTGAFIALAAMVNSAGDLWNAILESPIGNAERIFEQKSHEHFRETPIFDEEIQIPVEGSHKILSIYVYANADIFVNYSGVKQWLPADPESLAFDSPSLFSNAYAGGPFKEIVSAPQAVIHSLERGQAKSLGEIESLKEQKAQELEPDIKREYWFEEMKDDHPNFFQPSAQRYSFEVTAIPGYKITSYDIVPVSKANGSLVKHQLDASGDSITVELELESGPKFDQWRGWFKGKIVTNQQVIQ